MFRVWGFIFSFAISFSALAIVNGKTPLANDELKHSVVQVLAGPNSKCTGVLIQDQVVVTAAHCVDFPYDVQILVRNLQNESQKIEAANAIVIHPDYSSERQSSNRHSSDIAIIHLPQKFSRGLKSLEISNEKNNSSVLVYGFGKTEGSFLKKKPDESILYKKILKLSDYSSNQSHFDVIQENGGICFGDSGAPAFSASGKVIGIAVDVAFDPSRAFEANYEPCAHQALFLNLVYFQEWLVVNLARYK